MSAIEVAAGILRERAHGPVVEGGAIAPLTSYRLGGPAGVLFEPATDADLDALADAVRASGLEVLIVGRGSNMLVSDRGFPGIAVRLGAGFRWSRRTDDGIEAGAAMPLPALATFAWHEQRSGLEFGVAIPASVGGAVKMNAGAHGTEISDVLAEASLFELSTGERRTLPMDSLGLSYRRSRLPRGAIVTAAAFTLQPGDPERIARAMDDARAWRREHQPLNLPNGGSVFKNPDGDAAGRLVELVCGTELRVGRARISEVHANFIVAERGARADEVYTLIRMIQRRVLEETGIELEPEIQLMGEFREVGDEA